MSHHIPIPTTKLNLPAALTYLSTFLVFCRYGLFVPLCIHSQEKCQSLGPTKNAKQPCNTGPETGQRYTLHYKLVHPAKDTWQHTPSFCREFAELLSVFNCNSLSLPLTILLEINVEKKRKKKRSKSWFSFRSWITGVNSDVPVGDTELGNDVTSTINKPHSCWYTAAKAANSHEILSVTRNCFLSSCTCWHLLKIATLLKCFIPNTHLKIIRQQFESKKWWMHSHSGRKDPP